MKNSVAMSSSSVEFVRRFVHTAPDAALNADQFARAVQPRAYYTEVVQEVRRMMTSGKKVPEIALFFEAQATILSNMHETLFPLHEGLGLNITVKIGLNPLKGVEIDRIETELLGRGVEAVSAVKQAIGYSIAPYMLATNMISIARELKGE